MLKEQLFLVSCLQVWNRKYRSVSAGTCRRLTINYVKLQTLLCKLNVICVEYNYTVRLRRFLNYYPKRTTIR